MEERAINAIKKSSDFGKGSVNISEAKALTEKALLPDCQAKASVYNRRHCRYVPRQINFDSSISFWENQGKSQRHVWINLSLTILSKQHISYAQICINHYF